MGGPGDVSDPENAKLITLARSLRARNGAEEGAAVRDPDGRTYAASSVALPSLKLSALQAAVVVAASSGARKLDAAAVVTPADPGDVDIAAVADLGEAETPVYVAAPDGTPVGTRSV